MLKVSLHTASPTKSYTGKCSWSSNKPLTPKSQISQPLQHPFWVSKELPRAHVLLQPLLNPPRFFLHVIPLRIIGDGEKNVYSDSIHPSSSSSVFKGKEGQLLLSTVSQKDKQEKGVRVDFEIAPFDSQCCEHVTVQNACAVRDLTILVKHVKARKTLKEYSHLRHVPSSGFERKFLSWLEQAFRKPLFR